MPGALANLVGLTPALDSRVPGMNQATSNEGAFTLSDIFALKMANSSYVGASTGHTVAQTPTITYAVAGNMVTLDIPLCTGTSNATTFTITGGPAAIRPATAKVCMATLVDNGAAAVTGRVRVETDGTLTFFLTPALGAFTAAGTKSVTAGSISYTLA